MPGGFCRPEPRYARSLAIHRPSLARSPSAVFWSNTRGVRPRGRSWGLRSGWLFYLRLTRLPEAGRPGVAPSGVRYARELWASAERRGGRRMVDGWAWIEANARLSLFRQCGAVLWRALVSPASSSGLSLSPPLLPFPTARVYPHVFLYRTSSSSLSLLAAAIAGLYRVGCSAGRSSVGCASAERRVNLPPGPGAADDVSVYLESLLSHNEDSRRFHPAFRDRSCVRPRLTIWDAP